MAVNVSSSSNILNASSPFITPATQGRDSASFGESNVLSVSAPDQNAINIAYSFSPAASLALLSQPAASVLLTVQTEREPAYKPPPVTDSGSVAKADSTAPPPPAVLHPTLHVQAAPSPGKTKSPAPAVLHTSFDFHRAAAAFTKSSHLSAPAAPKTLKLNAFA